MNFKMYLGLSFNRKLDEEEIKNISVGEFGFISGDKTYNFDFNDSERRISCFFRSILHFELSNPDRINFPCIEKMTVDTFRNISEFTECFVYTGEDNETNLRVTSMQYASFEVDGKEIIVPDHVIRAWNKKLLKENNHD